MNRNEIIQDGFGNSFRIGNELGQGVWSKVFSARSQDGLEWALRLPLAPTDFPAENGEQGPQNDDSTHPDTDSTSQTVLRLAQLSRNIIIEHWLQAQKLQRALSIQLHPLGKALVQRNPRSALSSAT